MINYFKLFELPQTFELGGDDIEKKYLSLQPRFHPDKTVDEGKKIELIKKSADINEGYKILRSDVARAEHLMDLSNIRVNKESDNSYPVPQKILMEQMELRERVFDTQNDKIKEIQKEVRAEFKAVKTEFSALYNSQDYERASEKVVKLRYMMKLMEEIKKLKHAV